jgi:hypothetical protein
MSLFATHQVPISRADHCGPRRPTSPTDTCNVSQEQLVWALVGIFAQIAGMTTPLTCAQVEALAANYQCLERRQQLPALIALAAQILAQGGVVPPPTPGFGQQIFAGNWNGFPNVPTLVPPVAAAIAFDVSDGSVWNWWNNGWH